MNGIVNIQGSHANPYSWEKWCRYGSYGSQLYVIVGIPNQDGWDGWIEDKMNLEANPDFTNYISMLFTHERRLDHMMDLWEEGLCDLVQNAQKFGFTPISNDRSSYQYLDERGEPDPFFGTERIMQNLALIVDFWLYPISKQEVPLVFKIPNQYDDYVKNNHPFREFNRMVLLDMRDVDTTEDDEDCLNNEQNEEPNEEQNKEPNEDT